MLKADGTAVSADGGAVETAGALHYLNDQQSADCQQVIADLRQQIGQIPRDAFSVQQVYSQVEEAWTDGFWQYRI